MKTSLYALHKKQSFSLKISLVNVTKLEGSCGFDHIYWKILNGKLHFLYSDVCVRIKTIPRKFLFADPIRFLSYLPVTFVNFLKSRLIFLLFCCFWIIHLISQNIKGVLMWNIRFIIFMWRRRYWQIFKSALVNL